MSKPNAKDLSKREWMTLAEVRAAFGIARSTMYRLSSQGRLKFYRLDTRVKVRRADVEKLLKPYKRSNKPQVGRV